MGIYSLDNGLKFFFLYINAYIQNPKLHINELFHILYMYDSATPPHLTVQNGIKMKQLGPKYSFLVHDCYSEDD